MSRLCWYIVGKELARSLAYFCNWYLLWSTFLTMFENKSKSMDLIFQSIDFFKIFSCMIVHIYESFRIMYTDCCSHALKGRFASCISCYENNMDLAWNYLYNDFDYRLGKQMKVVISKAQCELNPTDVDYCTTNSLSATYT